MTDDARHALLKADALFKAGDLDGAEAAYDAIDFATCNEVEVVFQAFNNRGALMAVDAFDRCLALGPTFAAVVGRAEALAALGRHEEAPPRPPPSRSSPATGPRGPRLRRLRTGDAPGAAAALRAAADAGDGSATTARLLSVAEALHADLLARGGDLGGALALYRSALAGGGDAAARYNYALLLQRSGDGAGAVAELRRVVAAEPDHAAAHNALGLALLQRGDAAGAEPHLAKTSDLAPGDSERSYNVGPRRGRPAAAAPPRRWTPPPAAPADAALPVYAYARLKAPGPYPADVRAGARELHLSDDEFAAVFAVSKADFLRQPKWKQDNKKKKLGLF
ncbi:protein N-acetylglucosaminyltransferase [Aureococcus anophagefferens]|nr:protein N-acetylglucosaminyltransferase [Aureococcus anophagefferens]